MKTETLRVTSFEMTSESPVVVGLTPTGRATIQALHLNREELVNLRRVLYATGEHPPAEID